MNYKNPENKIEDEVLSGDERKIRALLGGLKRIDAPKDFDFRLRARIAEASPKIRRGARFLPILRYVLPLVLVLFVSAVVFKNARSGNSESAPQIVQSPSRTSGAPKNQSNETSAPVAAPPPESEIVSASSPDESGGYSEVKAPEIVSTRSGAAGEKIKNSQKPFDAGSPIVAGKSIKKPTPVISSKESDANIQGSSRTSASTSSRFIAPPGINPNQAVKISPNADGDKSLTVAEVLSQLGIDAVFTNANWTVKSVRQNSLAQRSGVRAADVVEAIDGEKLTDKPLKNKTVEGRKLMVARGSEKIEISLDGQLK